MKTLHLAHRDLPEEPWRAPLAVLRAAHEAGRIAPTPERMTMALDVRGLEGLQVDIDCHAREPEVDLWEAGLAIPTWDQLTALAELTGFPIAFFYRPAAEITPSQVFLCGPQDIDPPLEHLTGPEPAPQSPTRTGLPVRRPCRSRPNPAAADAAAKQVLAAREERRRARELIPAPPGWRTRR